MTTLHRVTRLFMWGAAIALLTVLFFVADALGAPPAERPATSSERGI